MRRIDKLKKRRAVARQGGQVVGGYWDGLSYQELRREAKRRGIALVHPRKVDLIEALNEF